jgi:hypothetical protein
MHYFVGPCATGAIPRASAISEQISMWNYESLDLLRMQKKLQRRVLPNEKQTNRLVGIFTWISYRRMTGV